MQETRVIEYPICQNGPSGEPHKEIKILLEILIHLKADLIHCFPSKRGHP